MESKFLDYIKLRYKAKLYPRQTGDEIMDNYFFCNIKREWDKVSKYIIDNIIINNNFYDTGESMTIYDKIRNIFLSRVHNRLEPLKQYNLPSKKYNIIYEEISMKQNPHAYRVQKFLERLKRDTPGWEDSCWCVGNHLDKILPDEIIELHDWNTFERAFNSWTDILGLGQNSFIAYQLALDMSYLYEYEDIDTFFILGPGAIKGMNMIYYFGNKEQVENLKKEDFAGEIPGVDYRKKIRDLQKYVNDNFEVKLHINDIEFNLCEYSKYFAKVKGMVCSIRNYALKEDKNI